MTVQPNYRGHAQTDLERAQQKFLADQEMNRLVREAKERDAEMVRDFLNRERVAKEEKEREETVAREIEARLTRAWDRIQVDMTKAEVEALWEGLVGQLEWVDLVEAPGRPLTLFAKAMQQYTTETRAKADQLGRWGSVGTVWLKDGRVIEKDKYSSPKDSRPSWRAGGNRTDPKR